MANSAGMLKESIWRDPDWRHLPRTAQATYAQLLSQKELDRAGMLPLQVSKWVKGCDEVTEATFWHDLKLLEARRFIFVDEDTDEVFIRTYMRHSEVTKYPQYLKSAIRCAGMVASPRLRHELASELRKLRRAEATALADEIDPGQTVPAPSPHPSETVPEPYSNPDSTVKGDGTVPAPSRVGERVGVVTSVGNRLGGARARDTDTTTDTDTPPPPNFDPNNPPDRYCPKHRPHGTDQPCGPCKSYRRLHDRWLAQTDLATKETAQAQARADLEARQAAQRQAAADRQAAIDSCELGCDDTGYLNGQICNHDPHQATTNANGLELVRKVLAGEVEPPEIEEDPDR